MCFFIFGCVIYFILFAFLYDSWWFHHVNNSCIVSCTFHEIFIDFSPWKRSRFMGMSFSLEYMKKAGINYECYKTLHMKFMVLKIIDISFHRMFSCKFHKIHEIFMNCMS